MTTFPLQAGPSAHRSPTAPTAAPSSSFGPSDLMALTTDMDSLAQHMRHCANARGKWPRVQRVLQFTHAVLLPRIVTVAAFGVLMAVATASVAVILGWVPAV